MLLAFGLQQPDEKLALRLLAAAGARELAALPRILPERVYGILDA